MNEKDTVDENEVDLDKTKDTEAGDSEAGESEGPTPEEVIKNLQEQITKKDEETRLAREETQKEREKGANFEQKANSAQENAIIAKENEITTALASAKSEVETVSALLERAYDEGDSKAVVELNKKLQEANYRSLRLAEGKEQLEAYKENQKNAPKVQTNEPSQRIKQWISDNPRFNEDAEFKAEAIAADSAARNRGIAPESDSYFKFIDERLAKVFGENDPPVETKKPTRPAATFAAPSTRQAPGSAASEKQKAALSATEKEMARSLGMSEDDYRKGKELTAARKQSKVRN